MVEINQNEYLKYWSLFKGNYVKGVHALQNILSNASQANWLASNHNAVAVLYGYAHNEEDINSEKLRELMIASNVFDKSLDTWFETLFEENNIVDVMNNPENRNKIQSDEYYWRLLNNSDEPYTRFILADSGIDISQYLHFNDIVTNYEAVAAIWTHERAINDVMNRKETWSVFRNPSKDVIAKALASISGLDIDAYETIEDVFTSDEAMTAVVNSKEAVRLIRYSENAMSEMVSYPTSYYHIWNNEDAISEIKKSDYFNYAYEIEDGVVAKAVARMADINTTTFSNMDSIASSGLARGAINDNQTATDMVYESAIALGKYIAGSNGLLPNNYDNFETLLADEENRSIITDETVTNNMSRNTYMPYLVEKYIENISDENSLYHVLDTPEMSVIWVSAITKKIMDRVDGDYNKWYDIAMPFYNRLSNTNANWSNQTPDVFGGQSNMFKTIYGVVLLSCCPYIKYIMSQYLPAWTYSFDTRKNIYYVPRMLWCIANTCIYGSEIVKYRTYNAVSESPANINWAGKDFYNQNNTEKEKLNAIKDSIYNVLKHDKWNHFTVHSDYHDTPRQLNNSYVLNSKKGDSFTGNSTATIDKAHVSKHIILIHAISNAYSTSYNGYLYDVKAAVTGVSFPVIYSSNAATSPNKASYVGIGGTAFYGPRYSYTYNNYLCYDMYDANDEVTYDLKEVA